MKLKKKKIYPHTHFVIQQMLGSYIFQIYEEIVL